MIIDLVQGLILFNNNDAHYFKDFNAFIDNDDKNYL